MNKNLASIIVALSVLFVSSACVGKISNIKKTNDIKANNAKEANNPNESKKSTNTIAILDVDKIIKESYAMRNIQSKISKKQTEYQKIITKKQKKLETEQKSIERRKSILSDKKFKIEAKKFEKKVDDLKTYVDRRQNSLKKASIDAMSKVNVKVREIVEEISEKKEIDIIIPASQALFYKDHLDISDEVLKKLNKEMTRVKVRFD